MAKKLSALCEYDARRVAHVYRVFGRHKGIKLLNYLVSFRKMVLWEAGVFVSVVRKYLEEDDV